MEKNQRANYEMDQPDDREYQAFDSGQRRRTDLVVPRYARDDSGRSIVDEQGRRMIAGYESGWVEVGSLRKDGEEYTVVEREATDQHGQPIYNQAGEQMRASKTMRTEKLNDLYERRAELLKASGRAALGSTVEVASQSAEQGASLRQQESAVVERMNSLTGDLSQEDATALHFYVNAINESEMAAWQDKMSDPQAVLGYSSAYRDLMDELKAVRKQLYG